MAKYHRIHKLRLEEIDKTRNFFIEEIKQNELISKKHKKIWKILNYTKHLHNLAYTVTECVLIADFASLVDIRLNIASSDPTINICITTV